MSVRILRAVALGLLMALAMLWWLLPRGVGELRKKSGLVERDQASALDNFGTAELGTVFQVGDGLRTAQRASAEVLLSEGPLLKIKQSTLIRFRGGEPGKARVQLARGELSIFTVEQPVLFETAAGLVRIAPHSRALLRERDDETWVEVILGRAELEWASEAPRALNAGESARASRAGESAAGNSAASTSAGQDAEPTRAGTSVEADAQADATQESGAVLTPDFELSTAPLITIFDGAPPTQLALRGRGCPVEKQRLEIERGARFLAQAGRVYAFPTGLTHYRLRCATKLVADGRVRVVKDTGQRSLADAPPVNRVEADGRAYNVLYQTRLPDLTFHWASAKPGDKCTLIVESGERRQTFALTGSEVVLPSGTVIDGEHRFWFEKQGTDQRSRTGQLSLRFDNTTPLGHLHEGGEIALENGASAHLSGVVVEGARVSIRGERVAVDRVGRFSTVVTPREGERGFAVMVELPRRSVVYYVRRWKVANASP